MTVSGPDSTHWCAILLPILGTLLAGAYLTLQTASTWVLERSKRCHSQIAKNRGSESRKIGDRQLQILVELQLTVLAADATH